MGWRFRRSIRLFPGLRLNLSKSGVSMTAGIRGLSVTTGKRGTYMNAGLPGTGLYSRQRIGAVSNTCRHEKLQGTFAANIDENGNVISKYQDGTVITDPALLKKIRSTEGYKNVERQLIERYNNEKKVVCSCGFHNLPTANFCSNCGKKLEKS